MEFIENKASRVMSKLNPQKILTYIEGLSYNIESNDKKNVYRLTVLLPGVAQEDISITGSGRTLYLNLKQKPLFAEESDEEEAEGTYKQNDKPGINNGSKSPEVKKEEEKNKEVQGKDQKGSNGLPKDQKGSNGPTKDQKGSNGLSKDQKGNSQNSVKKSSKDKKNEYEITFPKDIDFDKINEISIKNGELITELPILEKTKKNLKISFNK